MKPSRDGEYICLVHDQYRGNPEYVHGHVTAERAAEVIKYETSGIEVDLASLKHIYARKQFPSQDCPDGCDWEFRELTGPARGAFKVTRMEPKTPTTEASQ